VRIIEIWSLLGREIYR